MKNRRSMIEESYVLGYQVKERTKEKKPKDVNLGRLYHSKAAAETLKDLLVKGGGYESVWVSEVIGKDGIT